MAQKLGNIFLADRIYSAAEVDEKLAQIHPEYDFDNYPTPGSANPVTSNGIAQAIADSAQSVEEGVAQTYATKVELVETEAELDYKIAQALVGIVRYKGTVQSVADLPQCDTSNDSNDSNDCPNQIGDVYDVIQGYGDIPPGTNWAWNGSVWEPLAGSLADYLSKTQAAETYATKAALQEHETQAAETYATKTELSEGLAPKATRAELFPAWAANTAYTAYSLVIHGNAIYKCTEAHTSGAEWDSTKWAVATGTEVLAMLRDYAAQSSKPQINGVTLTGNKTAADLGLASSADVTLNGQWSYSGLPSGWNVVTPPYYEPTSPDVWSMEVFTDQLFHVTLSTGDGATGRVKIFTGYSGVTVTATLNGYNLGSQAEKTLASEAEAAELRTGKANDDAVVKLTGNQTIGGVKTFSEHLSIDIDDGGAGYAQILEALIGGIGGFAITYAGDKFHIYANGNTYDFPVDYGTFALLESIAPDWMVATQIGTVFSENQLASMSGKLYRCILGYTFTDQDTPTADTTHWTTATVEDVLAALRNGKLGKTEAITWSDLKAKRDNGTLVLGQAYRITDYVATVASSVTTAQSAGRPFDIIVVAVSTNTLSEEAVATPNASDSYFSPAGTKMEAWRVRYCLDNATSRFAWADASGNGRGVVYFLRDEFGNEAPYDFKGITFQPYKTASGTRRFAFDTGSGVDATLYGTTNRVFGNTIGEYRVSGVASLPNIAFSGTYVTNNVFTAGCHDISLGRYAYGNVFGPECGNISSGEYCQYNTFGPKCSDITTGTYLQYNCFGLANSNITLGTTCSRNSFGASVGNARLGNNCIGNRIADRCSQIRMGAGCVGNTIGAMCEHIVFGSAESDAGTKGYYYYVTVKEGNRYILLNCTSATSSSATYRNVTVNKGCNSANSWYTINDPNVNQTTETIYPFVAVTSPMQIRGEDGNLYNFGVDSTGHLYATPATRRLMPIDDVVDPEEPRGDSR